MFLSVATTMSSHPCEPRGVLHRLRCGVAVHLRLEGSEPTRREACHFTSADQCWDFIRRKLSTSRPLTIHTSNALITWRLIDGWREVMSAPDGGWKFVLASPPVVLRGRIDGCALCLLDIANHYRSSLSELGADLDVQELPEPSATASVSDWMDWCERRAAIIEAAIVGLRSLISTEDLGVWGKTIGECAMHAWRHRFMPSPVSCHVDEEALSLERDSYFGGRNECYYIGLTEQDVYHVDVNSLYPSIMRDQMSPVALMRVERRPTVSWLRANVGHVGLVAKVWIDCADDQYPKRIGDRPYYPVGVYPTVLAGPELATALERDHVVRVGVCAVYRLAPIFREYVDYFHGLKLSAGRQGKPALRLLAKLFLNSLYGKFAQQSPSHVVDPRIRPPIPWGPFTIRDIVDQTIHQAVAIADQTWVETDRAESFDAAPAISSYVTSAARVRMMAVKNAAGLGHYYYEDTDSLIVDAQGLDGLALAGLLGRDELGSVRVEAFGSSATIHTLKDYVIGDKRVLGSVARHAWQTGECQFSRYRWDNLRETANVRGASAVAMREEVRRIVRSYDKRTAADGGWTSPPRLMEAFDGGLT